MRSSTVSGAQSAAPGGTCTEAGITPTIVLSWPFSRSVCPIAAGSAPKRRRQKLSLSTTTSGAPGAESASTSARPRSGRVPRTLNRFPVVKPAAMRSGSPAPSRFVSKRM